MREFFRGRQRKSGCALLVLACVIWGLGIRSWIVDDRLLFQTNKFDCVLISGRGVVLWSRSSPIVIPQPPYWSSTKIVESTPVSDPFEAGATVRYLDLCGFRFGAKTHEHPLKQAQVIRTRIWVIPYSGLAFLTLCAAYLVLTFRRRVPTQSSPTIKNADLPTFPDVGIEG